MRGSHARCTWVWKVNGIIPAHAGLTERPSTSATSTRDHPRACGAHCFVLRPWSLRAGSSPRMRGSPMNHEKNTGNGGIIPAHAGLTGDCIEARRHEWDHPRACGAHQYRRYQGCHGLGIIPAHAGLTQVTLRDSESCRDHPRACGAHSEFLDSRRFVLGSSPRMRGSHPWR